MLKSGWDDPLPSKYVEEWEARTSKLPALNPISIPRFVGYNPDALFCEVHGFADASEAACSAVVYLRIIYPETLNCTLKVAKMKVAPLKKLSVPRLELLAAYILAKLVNHFIGTLSLKIDAIHWWSDSKDVLF